MANRLSERQILDQANAAVEREHQLRERELAHKERRFWRDVIFVAVGGILGLVWLLRDVALAWRTGICAFGGILACLLLVASPVLADATPRQRRLYLVAFVGALFLACVTAPW